MNFKSIILIIAINFTALSQLVAQSPNNRQSIAVMNVDAFGFSFNSAQMRNLVHVELLKLKLYDVIDGNEIDFLMKENQINPSYCYNTSCLIEVGEKLRADKVLTGKVEIFGEKILINFRVIDVKMERVIVNEVWEFLNLPNQIQTMIHLSLQKLFNKKVDEDLMNKLTKGLAFENTTKTLSTENLKLEGPRMGVTIFSGDLADGFELDKNIGGYGASPVMFQFGYQFEVRYLTADNIQAVFEFIPLITGLDQGLFIPSFSFLHGLRSNKTGLEFAVGPVFSVVKMEDLGNGISIPSPEGDPKLKTGFVFGFGKTFRAGPLNFPVNGFFIPGKSGHRYGFSVGFNKQSY